MYITGFCLLAAIWDILIFMKGESEISFPSNSQRPLYFSEVVKYQRIGLNTPTMYPEQTANTKSAFWALWPHSRQYFLVHSYKLGLSHRR